MSALRDIYRSYILFVGPHLRWSLRGVTMMDPSLIIGPFPTCCAKINRESQECPPLQNIGFNSIFSYGCSYSYYTGASTVWYSKLLLYSFTIIVYSSSAVHFVTEQASLLSSVCSRLQCLLLCRFVKLLHCCVLVPVCELAKSRVMFC